MCVWYDCTSGTAYFSDRWHAVQMSAPGDEQWIKSGRRDASANIERTFLSKA